jgi:hypothetical protein
MASQSQPSAENTSAEPSAAHKLREAAGGLQPLTGQGEDYIWRPANRAWVALTQGADLVTELVAALAEAERFLDYFTNGRTYFEGDGTPRKAHDLVRAALRKATGTQT